MDMEEVKAVTARLNERIPSHSEALDDLALLRDFALAAIPVIEVENAALRTNAERLKNDVELANSRTAEMTRYFDEQHSQNAALREKLAASKQEVEVQKAKADKHYELGTEYFDLMVKAEREIAGLQKLLKRSATYIVDYPLSGQRDRIFLNQIDAALNKIDAVITTTGEEQ